MMITTPQKMFISMMKEGKPVFGSTLRCAIGRAATYKSSSASLLLLLAMLWFAPLRMNAQIELTGAMVNACGVEGDQEFVTLFTTGDIDPNLLVINYGSDMACSVAGIVVYNMMMAEPPGFIASLNALAGCTAFVVASNPIPAGSNVVVFDINMDPNSYTGWNTFCSTTTYVLFTNLPNSGGNFSNAMATRYFCVSYNGSLQGIYGYTNVTSSIDGTTASWAGSGTVNSNIPASANCSFGAVAPCAITAITVTPTSTCNNNGTPANPADDYFTASITVTFSNKPTTGNLEIFLNGSGTALASVGVAAITSPYTFTGIQIPANGAGYTLTATFSSSPACTFMDNFTALASCSSCAGFTVSGTGTAPSCQGNTNGSITLNPVGGVPAYTFSYNGTASGSGSGLSITNLAAGSYNITVTAGNGCMATTTVNVPAGPTPPTPNPAGPLTACDNGSGQATFNLSSLNNTISGGVGTVSWWTNMAATNPIANTMAYLSGSTTVYATVVNGACSSSSVAIVLTVNPVPTANTAPPQFACANAMGQATFNLTSLNNTISGGAGTVNWWTNSGATTAISNPGSHTISGSVLVYATVTVGGCPSVPVGVQLNATPTPTANPAGPLVVCSTAPGGSQATFNLTTLNSTINNVPSNTVNWYTDAAGTMSIGSPAAFTSGSTTVYAGVSNGFCSSALVPVVLTVTPTPSANPAGPLNTCATTSGGNQANFNLSSLNAAISGGAGAVNWWTNAAGTNPIGNPASFTSGSTTVYATVDNGPCESSTIPVSLVVNPTPTANATSFNVCVISVVPPNVQYDLPGTEAIINGNTGQTVNWYTDAAGNNPIDDITDVLTLPGTVYATVDNGTCESPTVPVPVNIVFAPAANTASASACAGPGGTATFNLTTLNSTINGGTANTVTFYTNMAGTMPIATPTAFTTTSTTIYARVSTATGCSSNPVAITLTVNPTPTANTANAQACNNGAGQGVFNLSNLNSVVSGGSGTVNWWTNMAATNPIANPASYTSAPGTVYATVTAGPCTSAPVAITLSLVAAPQAFPASMNACALSGGQAVFNLTNVNNIVNGANGFPVNWYTDINGANPIGNPAAYTSASATVYAQVASGTCQSPIVAVTLTVVPTPNAVSPPAQQACASSGNQAVFNLSSLNSIVNAGSGNTVTWYTNPAATAQISNPAAFNSGSTTVYAVVSNGSCSSAPVPLQLTVTPTPTATAANLAACSTAGNQANFNLTSLNATISGGTGTVGWFVNMAGTNPISNPGSFTSAATTVYASVTNNGCTSATVPIVLSVNPRPSVSATIDNQLDCNGDNDGSISVQVTNGAMPYNFNWNVNALDGIEDPAGLAAGAYSLTVTDVNNCQGTASVSLTEPTALTLTCSELNPVSTPGGSNGAAQVSISGASAPYSISWSGPSSGSQTLSNAGNATISNLSAGIYNITVTDFNGCTETCTTTINGANCNFAVSLSGTAPSCAGGNDGSANLSITSGSAPFTFDWSVDAFDGVEDPSGLSAGDYSVTVTENNTGCLATATVTLTDPAALSLSCAQLNPVSAAGASDGAANISFGGGVAPYILQWSGPLNGGQNENAAGAITINNLQAGTYQLTITDFNGCESNCSFVINQAGCNFSISLSATHVTCNGAANGTIEVATSNGMAPYTYDWNIDSLDGQFMPDSLDIGTYIVMVTDSNACVATDTIVLTQPDSLLLSCSEASPVSAAGQSDGVANVQIDGGQYPYTLLVDGPITDSIGLDTAGIIALPSLPGGTYYLTLTDSLGCQVTCEVTITTPGCNLAVNLTPHDLLCGSDGSIDANVVGGTAPLTFDWSEDSIDGQLSPGGLEAGVYTLTVTDDAGCTANASVTLSDANVLTLSCAQLSPVTLANGSNGVAQLILTGGTLPYTVQIVGPVSQTITINAPGPVDIPNLVGGDYTVFLNDAGGCSTACLFTIDAPVCDLDLSLTSSNLTCFGGNNGSITITVNSAVMPYTFDWNVDALDGVQSPTGLAAGAYSLSFSDAIGCSTVLNSTLSEPAELIVSCNILNPITIVGGNDGSAFIDVTGGVAGYTIQWTGIVSGSATIVGNNHTVSNLPAGIYTFDITDSNGCTASCTLTLQDPVCLMNLSQVTQPETCTGDQDGSIDLTVNDGTGPFVFNWDINALDGIEDPAGLAPGNYSVTVTDAIGCTANAAINIAQGNSRPTIALSGDGFVCEDNCRDFVLTVTGAQPFDISYTLNAGAGDIPFTINSSNTSNAVPICPANFGLSAGDISITITALSDANCPATVSNTASMTVVATTTFAINETLCEGESIVVNGVSYGQLNPNGVEVISGGNAAGCDSIINIALTFLPAATATIDTLLCDGGSITVGATTFNAANPTGVITLDGAAANGCDSVITVSTAYRMPIATTLNPTLCIGETLVVNGVTYSQANPSGQQIMAAVSGCDSTITVALQFYPAATSSLDSLLCDGGSLTVNGVTYNEANASGTEILAGLAANGCDSTVVIALSFLDPVSETLSPTLCPGESLTVNGQTYDAAQPSGTEVLIGGSATGCDSTIFVNLSFYPPTQTDITTSLCAGESIMVGTTIYNQNNPSGTTILTTTTGCDSVIVVNLSFLQPSNSSISQTLCNGESLLVGGQVFNAANPAGTVVIAGGGVNGCDSTIVVALQFHPALTAAIAGDAAICAGVSTNLTLQLSGASQFDVVYTNGSTQQTLSGVSNGFSFAVTPGATTTYTLVSASAAGTTCPVVLSGSALVQVSTLNTQINISSNYDGFGVSCAGAADGSLSASASGGLAPVNYSWSNNASGATLSGLAPGSYSVTATDAAGCMGTAQATLTEPPAITLKSSDVMPACYGDANGGILIELLQGGSGGPYSFSLDGNNFQSFPGAPYTVPNLPAGSYTLYIQDANGCQTNADVTIQAPSELLLELGEDQTIRLGDSLLLDPQYNFMPAEVRWAPDTFLTDPLALATYARPSLTTTYVLTATDANGCTTRDLITIFIDARRQVYIPNAFSPDDDGINDRLTVFAGDDVAEVRAFRIFDRWGNMLFFKGPFQPNDETYGWDGTFNGKNMNAGVYVFYAEVVFVDGWVEAFKGDVILIR